MYSYFLSYETSVRWELFSPVYEEADKKETKLPVSGHTHTLWDKSDFALTGDSNWHLLISTSKSEFIYHYIATTWVSVLRHCYKILGSSWSPGSLQWVPPASVSMARWELCWHIITAFVYRLDFPVQYLLLQGQCLAWQELCLFLLKLRLRYYSDVFEVFFSQQKSQVES